MTIDMLARLTEAEEALPKLLEDEEGWTGLYVDYERPFVERLWRAWGDYRLNLHRIHPCDSGQALWHPHPWPSAMRIHEGSYEMRVGYGDGEAIPATACRLVLVPGSTYEMVELDGWHAVRPLVEPVYTFMLTGKPWSRSSPKSVKPLAALTSEQRANLFAFFRKRYQVSV